MSEPVLARIVTVKVESILGTSGTGEVTSITSEYFLKEGPGRQVLDIIDVEFSYAGG